MEAAVQHSVPRELGWFTGGVFGAALGTAIEWSWQGSWAVLFLSVALLLILAIGFACIGTYIAGFAEDSWLRARQVVELTEREGQEDA